MAMTSQETRPVLYLLYWWDEPDSAIVLSVSGSLEEARQDQQEFGCGVIYRSVRQADGTYAEDPSPVGGSS